MAQVRAGSRPALAELYDRHAPAMYGLACRILSDAGEAEDLVHDVFVEAWRKAASWSAARGSVRSWLLIRIRSRGIDRVRSRSLARRHVESERARGEPARTPDSIHDPSLSPDQRRARRALAALPEGQRRVIDLAYFEGLSCSEIAKRCGMPLGTVKSRMAAGLRGLRAAFDARGEDA